MSENDCFNPFEKRKVKSRLRFKPNWSRLAHNEDYQHTYGFTCIHCRSRVCNEESLSGVRNRNHCPYCLWSKHVDLFEAGDRLAACKAPMQPVGLSLKQTLKKYGGQSGELMVIHLCCDCGGISLNRIAADDDAANLYDVHMHFQHSPASLSETLEKGGILPLNREDSALVYTLLYGWADPAV